MEDIYEIISLIALNRHHGHFWQLRTSLRHHWDINSKWHKPTGPKMHECPFVFLFTRLKHILYSSNFLFCRYFIKQNRNFIENDLPSVILCFPLFLFLLKQLFRETCLCSKKYIYALTHNNCYYQFLFPILLFSL